VRFTPEMLNKIAELAQQSNMSRNALIESVVCEYVQAETAIE
jgi:predicted transcriptional regulator